jgi:hypothetical protein
MFAERVRFFHVLGVPRCQSVQARSDPSWSLPARARWGFALASQLRARPRRAANRDGVAQRTHGTGPRGTHGARGAVRAAQEGWGSGHAATAPPIGRWAAAEREGRGVVSPPTPPHILVVDAESDIFERLAPAFTASRYRITHVRDVAAARDVLDAVLVDVVLVDTRLLNAVGTMLVGQAAFGVPLLPLPANYPALEEAVRARPRRPPEVPSTKPVAVDHLLRWIGDALRSPELKSGF